MEDEVLRVEVRLIKSFYKITYKTIAEILGIKQRSLYNWLAGQFELSGQRKRQLRKYIEKIKER